MKILNFESKFTLLSIIFVVLLTIILLTNMTVSAVEQTILSIGTNNTADSSVGQGIDHFIEIVTEKSEGNIKVEYFPAGQLVPNALEHIELVMMGSLDINVSRLDWYSNFAPEYNILGLVFGFATEDEYYAFLETDINQKVKEKLIEKFGLRIICDNWRNAPRNLLARYPILKAEDIVGLKLRVPEIASTELAWRIIGAATTPIPMGEVYLALSTGVVDAIELNIEVLYGYRLQEAAKYMVLTNHTFGSTSWAINEQKYQSLPEEHRKIILDALEEVSKEFTMKAFQEEKILMETIKREDGVVFIDFDKSLLTEKAREIVKGYEREGTWEEGWYDEAKSQIRDIILSKTK